MLSSRRVLPKMRQTVSLSRCYSSKPPLVHKLINSKSKNKPALNDGVIIEESLLKDVHKKFTLENINPYYLEHRSDLLRMLVECPRVCDVRFEKSKSDGNVNSKLTESDLFKRPNEIICTKIPAYKIDSIFDDLLNPFLDKNHDLRISDYDIIEIVEMLLSAADTRQIYVEEASAESLFVESISKPVVWIMKRILPHGRVDYNYAKLRYRLFEEKDKATKVNAVPDGKFIPLKLKKEDDNYWIVIVEIKKANIFQDLTGRRYKNIQEQVVYECLAAGTNVGILSDGLGAEIIEVVDILEIEGKVVFKLESMRVLCSEYPFTDKKLIIYALLHRRKQNKRELKEKIRKWRKIIDLTDEEIDMNIHTKFYTGLIGEEENHLLVTLEDQLLRRWRECRVLGEPVQSLTLTIKELRDSFNLDFTSKFPLDLVLHLNIRDEVWSSGVDSDEEKVVSNGFKKYYSVITESSDQNLNTDLIYSGKIRLVNPNGHTIGYGNFQVLIQEDQPVNYRPRHLSNSDKSQIREVLRSFHSNVGLYGRLGINNFLKLKNIWYIVGFFQQRLFFSSKRDSAALEKRKLEEMEELDRILNEADDVD